MALDSADRIEVTRCRRYRDWTIELRGYEMRVICMAQLCLVLMALPAYGQTVHVIGPTHPFGIQSVIDSVEFVNNDIIELLDGVYTGPGNNDLIPNDKSFTLRSRSGAATTIIDCQNQAMGAIIEGFEVTIQLEGITIRNATKGAYCSPMAFLRIERCVFEDCGTGAHSHSIHGAGATLRIAHCLFQRNTEGVYADDGGYQGDGLGSTFIEDSVFCSNEYGLRVRSGARARADRSVFHGNTYGATTGGGWHNEGSLRLNSCTVTGNVHGIVGEHSLVLARHSIIWGNGTDATMEGYGDCGLTFQCCVVDPEAVSCSDECWGGATYDEHCIAEDPIFCDPQPGSSAPTCEGDYGLSSNSPCVASASPCGVQIGALDVACDVVASKQRSWSEVKNIFR